MMTVSFTVSTGDRRGLASSTVRNRLLRIVCKEVPGHGCYASKLQNEGLVGRGIHVLVNATAVTIQIK